MTREDLIEDLIEGVLKNSAPTAPSVLGKPRRKQVDWRKMAEVGAGAFVGHILGSTLGAGTGAAAGATPHILKHAKASNELNKRMNPPKTGDSRLSRKGVNLLDPKAFISGEHYKEKLPPKTTWINTPEQAEKKGRKSTFDAISRGQETSQMQTDLTRFTVITPRKHKIARDVVAHEVGHAKDYQANPATPTEVMTRALGGGSAIPREKAAWDASGVPQGSAIRKHALDTYKHSEKIPKATEAGAVNGAIGGSVAGAFAGGLAAAKGVDKRRATNLKKAKGRINLLHTKPQIAREDTMTREELIEAIIESAYTPPEGLKKLRGRNADWDRHSSWVSTDPKTIRRDIELGWMTSDDPMLRHSSNNLGIRDQYAIKNAATWETGKTVKREYNKRRGLLWHQARKAGYEKDVSPHEIMRQAALMMPQHLDVDPSTNLSQTSTDILKAKIRERGKSQRLRHKMLKRGAKYTPSLKAKFTKKMKANRNFQGTSRSLPESFRD